MSLAWLTLIFFAMLLGLLAMGLPLVYCFGGTAVIFIAWQMGPDALYTVATTAYGEWTNFILVAIPLFIFMANLLQRSGVAEDMYEMMYRWLSGVRGGLAMGTVGICALFAAMAGLSAVGTVTMGLIALPSMLKRRYDKHIAIGCISAGGALGILIPPSVIMVLYGSLTGASVGKLFMAGLIPGILLALIFIVYIGVRCFFQPHLGPPVPKDETNSWKLRLMSLRAVILPVILILLVLGLIYIGVCTPTEASGIGAMGSLIVLIINRKFSWKVLHESLTSTCKLSAMVLWILFGAKCFTNVYTAMGASEMVQTFFSSLEINRWVMLLGMQVLLIIMGCFMDPGGIIMICTPVFVPIITELGFDPIWFGILFTINMELGYITPPFGFNLFYMKALAEPQGIAMKDIYRSIVPFVLLTILGLIVIMVFPEIVMWLPQHMAQ